MHDRFERNELFAHPRSNRAHGAGPIDHGEANVITALVPLHRHAVRLNKRGGGPAERRHTDPASDVDNICRDRRRGRIAACPRSDQGQLPDRIAVDRNRVEHAHGLGKRRALGDHRRMHPLLNTVGSSFSDAQELDAKPKFVRGAQVGERDCLDSFDGNSPCVDLGAERERGEDRELVRGVKTADVECRIGLGIAKLLSLVEADLERKILDLHARENVVAGAIEDTGNPLNRIARQALSESLDDGYAAAHCCFEEQLSARSLGHARELETVRREHRLIRGDDGSPARQRGFDGVESNSLGAADQFNENVDVTRGR